MTTISSDLTFDFIIVGGGSAGCVLANRLSADPRHAVLLVEAGDDTPPEAVPPAILDGYPMALFHGEKWIWPNLNVFPNRGRNPGKSRLYEQGRVMGGGSSVNVQAANRGLPRDYDRWASLGAAGWSWNDVLPYFKKLESDQDFDGPLHGRDGPLPIRRIFREQWPAFARQIASHLGSRGFADLDDQNGEFGDGILPPSISNINGRRVSAAMAYLTPAVRRRQNLTIASRTRVERLLLEGPRATGVRIDAGDGIRDVRGHQIIVTAGALRSPALLMRAGIGEAGALQNLGIDVVADRPGVGQNLRDHPAITTAAFLPPHLRLDPAMRRPNHAVLRFSTGADAPPSDMYFVASNRASWHAIGQRLGLFLLWCNQPTSVGSVTLTSPDSRVEAAIDLNLLGTASDLQRLADAFTLTAGIVLQSGICSHADDLFPAAFSGRSRAFNRLSRKNAILTRLGSPLLDAPPWLRHWFIRNFITDGVTMRDLLTDRAALEAYLHAQAFGIWHVSGTCKMGSRDDAMAVVDPDGRVIGVDGLLVADASIMPDLPTANTNLPTLMIAEKIADGLLRDCR